MYNIINNLNENTIDFLLNNMFLEKDLWFLQKSYDFAFEEIISFQKYLDEYLDDEEKVI